MEEQRKSVKRQGGKGWDAGSKWAQSRRNEIELPSPSSHYATIETTIGKAHDNATLGGGYASS